MHNFARQLEREVDAWRKGVDAKLVALTAVGGAFPSAHDIAAELIAQLSSRP